MSSYPVAYRRPARAPVGPGFQGPRPAANDNFWRPARVPFPPLSPANDNPRGPVGPLRGGPGMLRRVLPWYALVGAFWYVIRNDESEPNLHGWTPRGKCAAYVPLSGLTGQLTSSLENATMHGQADMCLGLQASVTPWGDPIPSYAKSVGLMRHTSYAGESPRFTVVRTWSRPGTGPAEHPDIGDPISIARPSPARAYDPVVYYPSLDPISIPVPVGFPTPASEPRPIPYEALPLRTPNPFRSPTEAPSWGYTPPVPPAPPVPPGEVPGPGQEVIVGPGGQADAGTPRRPSRAAPVQPPRKGERERKATVALSGVPARIVNFATEGLDVVNALYDALLESPAFRAHLERTRFQMDLNAAVNLEDLFWRSDFNSVYSRHSKGTRNSRLAAWRRRQSLLDHAGYARETWRDYAGPKTPLQKAAAVYKHLDKLDMARAMLRLAQSQMEDYFWGKVGRQSAKASGKIGRPVGVQFGPLF